MMIFDAEKECVDFLASRFAQVGVPRDAIKAYVEHSDEVKRVETPTAPPGGFPVLLPKSLAIRDDDLKILDALIDGLKAAAGAGFFLLVFTGPQATAAIAGVLMAGARLIRQLWTKSVSLSPDDHRILFILKSPSTNSLPARLNNVRWHDLVCRAF
jgi:hypothetical protein